MSMLQIHANARAQPTVVYHEFLVLYKKNENLVYGIIEGEGDRSFYTTHISNRLPDNWDICLIAAHKRDNVISSRMQFDWQRFPINRICFFVDQDFSAFMPDKPQSHVNLYITDNYSIENEVIDTTVLKRFLREVLNIRDIELGEMENVESLFLTSLDFFREIMTPVMVQLIIWQRNADNISYKDINLKKIFTFQNGQLILNPEYLSTQSLLQYIAGIFNLPLSDQELFSEVESEFLQQKGVEKFIRGKFLIWFFVEFALEIHSSVNKYFKRHHKSPKYHLTVSSNPNLGNAFLLLAPLQRCPNSLKIFLDKNYLSYIENKYE